MNEKESFTKLLLDLKGSKIDIASVITIEASGKMEIPTSNYLYYNILLSKVEDNIIKIILHYQNYNFFNSILDKGRNGS